MPPLEDINIFRSFWEGLIFLHACNPPTRRSWTLPTRVSAYQRGPSLDSRRLTRGRSPSAPLWTWSLARTVASGGPHHSFSSPGQRAQDHVGTHPQHWDQVVRGRHHHPAREVWERDYLLSRAGHQWPRQSMTIQCLPGSMKPEWELLAAKEPVFDRTQYCCWGETNIRRSALGAFMCLLCAWGHIDQSQTCLRLFLIKFCGI